MNWKAKSMKELKAYCKDAGVEAEEILKHGPLNKKSSWVKACEAHFHRNGFSQRAQVTPGMKVRANLSRHRGYRLIVYDARGDEMIRYNRRTKDIGEVAKVLRSLENLGADLKVEVRGASLLDELNEALAADLTVAEIPKDTRRHRVPVIGVVATTHPNLQSFAGLVQAAGMTDALLQPDFNAVVFIPSDEAIEELPEDAVEYLMVNRDALQTVLENHIVQITPGIGKGFLASIAGDDLTTLAGETITINADDIVESDIAANNGMVHIIDTVLLPDSLGFDFTPAKAVRRNPMCYCMQSPCNTCYTARPSWIEMDARRNPMEVYAPSSQDMNNAKAAIRAEHPGVQFTGEETYLVNQSGSSNKYHAFLMTNLGGFNAYARIGYKPKVVGPMSPGEWHNKMGKKIRGGYNRVERNSAVKTRPASTYAERALATQYAIAESEMYDDLIAAQMRAATGVRRNGKSYPADEYTLEGYKTHGPCEDCGIQMNDENHRYDTSGSRRGAGAGTGTICDECYIRRLDSMKRMDDPDSGTFMWQREPIYRIGEPHHPVRRNGKMGNLAHEYIEAVSNSEEEFEHMMSKFASGALDLPPVQEMQKVVEKHMKSVDHSVHHAEDHVRDYIPAGMTRNPRYAIDVKTPDCPECGFEMDEVDQYDNTFVYLCGCDAKETVDGDYFQRWFYHQDENGNITKEENYDWRYAEDNDKWEDARRNPMPEGKSFVQWADEEADEHPNASFAEWAKDEAHEYADQQGHHEEQYYHDFMRWAQSEMDEDMHARRNPYDEDDFNPEQAMMDQMMRHEAISEGDWCPECNRDWKDIMHRGHGPDCSMRRNPHDNDDWTEDEDFLEYCLEWVARYNDEEMIDDFTYEFGVVTNDATKDHGTIIDDTNEVLMEFGVPIIAIDVKGEVPDLHWKHMWRPESNPNASSMRRNPNVSQGTQITPPMHSTSLYATHSYPEPDIDDETMTQTQFVSEAYRGIMQREPDKGGHTGYRRILKGDEGKEHNRGARESILRSLHETPEAQKIGKARKSQATQAEVDQVSADFMAKRQAKIAEAFSRSSAFPGLSSPVDPPILGLSNLWGDEGWAFKYGGSVRNHRRWWNDLDWMTFDEMTDKYGEQELWEGPRSSEWNPGSKLPLFANLKQNIAPDAKPSIICLSPGFSTFYHNGGVTVWPTRNDKAAREWKHHMMGEMYRNTMRDPSKPQPKGWMGALTYYKNGHYEGYEGSRGSGTQNPAKLMVDDINARYGVSIPIGSMKSPARNPRKNAVHQVMQCDRCTRHTLRGGLYEFDIKHYEDLGGEYCYDCIRKMKEEEAKAKAEAEAEAARLKAEAEAATEEITRNPRMPLDGMENRKPKKYGYSAKANPDSLQAFCKQAKKGLRFRRRLAQDHGCPLEIVEEINRYYNEFGTDNDKAVALELYQEWC